MDKKYLQLSALALLLISSSVALAMPFDSFDPRSMGMGTTGVAVGDPSLAPFFNPAMLTATDPSKKYSIEFPVVGARLYDPGNLRNNLPTLSDNINALSASITAANATANSTNPTVLAQLPGNMTTVANNIDKVNSNLSALNNKPLQGEFGAAAVIGIPATNWGFAFYADAWGAMGGTVEYTDATTLSNLSTSVRSAANALSATTTSGVTACQNVATGHGSQADITTCLNAASNVNSQLVNAQGAIQFATNTGITSKIHIRGVAIEESGLSISHSFIAKDQSSWSIGFTPKVMNLQLFDALLAANNGTSTSGITGNDYLAKYNTLNLDVGVAKSYNNGWRTGVVVKNVVPQTFDFKNAPQLGVGATPIPDGATLTMNPQARFGVSHENAWSTIAFDMDITKNNPAGLENQSQFVGIGGELSAWGWAQIRAGYRTDLVTSGQQLISLGFGLSPRIPYFKPHLDFAVSASPNIIANGWNNASQVGASLKLGLNY
jgi:hypothetical protein